MVQGAVLMCPFGTVPGVLKGTSQTVCLADGKPAGTIKDAAANMNITSFGMCQSLANPQVASATAAALGVLTPQPCSLVTAGVWLNGKNNILVSGTPVLSSESQLLCQMGQGVITVKSPGQTKIVV